MGHYLKLPFHYTIHTSLKNKPANSKYLEKFSQVDIFETRNTFKTPNNFKIFTSVFQALGYWQVYLGGNITTEAVTHDGSRLVSEVTLFIVPKNLILFLCDTEVRKLRHKEVTSIIHFPSILNCSS